MGVTPEQSKILKEIAAILFKDAQVHGKALFIKIFEANPSWADKFSFWRGLTLDQIKASEKISTHGGLVASEVANWFNNIDNPDALLKRQAGIHKNRGVTIEDFETVLSAAHATLEQQMGGAYTPVMRDAVTAAWRGVIVPGLKAGY